MSSRLGILALAALCCPWLCQTAQHQGGATSKQNVTQDTGGQSHRATILLHTEERWGGMPDDIDTDRSITLHTEPNQVFSPTNSMWVEQVGTHPRVYLFHNFLTPAERAHMIRVAAPLMRRSSVVGQKGESVIDSIRTSYGMFIRRMSDPIIERIERRISLVTHVPISYQEDIQVLRYSVGQKYGAHYDSNGNTREPGPHYRQATFYMYLSDVEEGGETAFPHNSEWADPSIPAKLQAAGVQFSECAKGHVAAKPKAGDAALFYSFHPNLTMDEASMHTGCPVVKGIKWGAPVWIHQQEFEHAGFLEQQRKRAMGRVEYPPEPGMCDDRHKQCGTWAAAGECSKNPEYMTGAGAGDGIGMCTRSCGVCRTCNSGDITCINENRAKAGYLPLDRAEMEWLGVNWWLGSAPSPEL